ncbi:MAG: MerR family transcriptional regulator [Pirellulales bacterium]|nr:MerR family transcriptional regulator [Pirellulales bacterium]
MFRSDDTAALLQSRRAAFLGKLASMNRREAGQLLKSHGATVLDAPDASADLLVVGEEELPFPQGENLDDWLDEATRQAAEEGSIEILTETQLWQRLGLVDREHDIHRLYTPAMLADLLKVPVTVIRRWHRRGLIVPAREVRKLPYFDFQEVAAARQLANLLAAGMTPQSIEKKLAQIARYLPGVTRPLAQLSVIVQGKQILLRQGDGLIEPGGQMHFDFETAAAEELPAPRPLPATPELIANLAAELEEDGQLVEAAEMYRAAMAAGGPKAELCFQTAELLYRLGDLSAARERYYMAVELNEDYVEARANLGCVLAETGQRDLAVAAFEGALKFHPDYADVHYHLARTLEDLHQSENAAEHWRRFLELSPDSPWAEEARHRT